MTIIESNRLLADFMGYEGQHEEWCGNNVIREEPNFLPEEERLSPYRPEESWSDLMEVVEKIESLQFKLKSGTLIIEYRFSVLVESNYCIIKPNTTWASIASDVPYDIRHYCDTKLQSTYSAVLQFIQWFNTQKQSV